MLTGRYWSHLCRLARLQGVTFPLGVAGAVAFLSQGAWTNTRLPPTGPPRQGHNLFLFFTHFFWTLALSHHTLADSASSARAENSPPGFFARFLTHLVDGFLAHLVDGFFTRFFLNPFVGFYP